jgi:hypothetical protein
VTVPPAQVTVDVLNATGTKGLAATAAEALKAEGFVVGEVGNDPSSVTTSVVRFGPDVEAPARTAAAAVPGSVLQRSDALAGKVQIVLGPGYSTIVPVEVQAPQPETPATSAPAPAAPTPAAAPANCG